MKHREHLSHPKPFRPHIENNKPRSFSQLAMSHQIMRDMIGAFINRVEFFCFFNPIFIIDISKHCLTLLLGAG